AGQRTHHPEIGGHGILHDLVEARLPEPHGDAAVGPVGIQVVRRVARGARIDDSLPDQLGHEFERLDVLVAVREGLAVLGAESAVFVDEQTEDAVLYISGAAARRHSEAELPCSYELLPGIDVLLPGGG